MTFKESLSLSLSPYMYIYIYTCHIHIWYDMIWYDIHIYIYIIFAHNCSVIIHMFTDTTRTLQVRRQGPDRDCAGGRCCFRGGKFGARQSDGTKRASEPAKKEPIVVKLLKGMRPSVLEGGGSSLLATAVATCNWEWASRFCYRRESGDGSYLF